MKYFTVHSYIISNLLLILSLVLFLLCSHLIRQFQFNFKQHYFLRISQFLIFSSVILGVVSPYLPGGMKIQGVTPHASFLETLDEPSFGSSDVRRSDTLTLGSQNRDKRIYLDKEFFLQLFCILFVVGFFYHLGKFIFDTYSLFLIFKNSTCFKKIRKTEILVSDQAIVPFATRLFYRAHIIVPTHFLESKRNLKIAIRHEIQHHRNQDTLWILWMELLKIAFFFNPAIYLWRKKVDDLLEFACDEALVLRGQFNASDYGDCLLGVAESLSQSRRILSGTTAMAKVGVVLLTRRIQQLFDYKSCRKGIQVATVVFLSCNSLLLLTAFVLGGSPETLPASLLHLNPSTQSIANRALLEGIEKSSARGAYTIVTELNTSGILAVSYCKSLNEDCMDAESASRILSKKLVQPVSLIKPIIMAYAIDRGFITQQETLDTALQKTTPTEVLIQSSRSGIIEIAKKLKPDGLVRAMEEFGINQNSHSFPKDLVDFAIGKNLFLSPLEISNAYQILLNPGQVISPRTLDWTKEALVGGVTAGTGSNAQSLLYSTGGKTATAFAYSTGTKKYQKELGEAQFIGFAPVKNPKILVYVVVESPEGSSLGNTHAAPIFKKIIEETLTFLKISPDRQ